VARSRSKPENELHDPAAWAQLWYDARRHLAETEYNAPFNRWDGSQLVCA
jgi:hypothetical protein